MGEYSKYRGRSTGRILHALDVYCDTYHRLSENARIGDGDVLYHDAKVATYHWETEGLRDIKGLALVALPDDDVPYFDFWPTPSVSQECVNLFHRAQYLKRPFLDDFGICSVANWAVQELRHVLTYDEALAIRHVRDRLKGEWNDTTVGPKIVEKIQATLQEIAESQLSYDAKCQKLFLDNWKHWAFCTVYEI